MDPLILPAISKIVSQLFYKDNFGMTLSIEFDISLNKETKLIIFCTQKASRNVIYYT